MKKSVFFILLLLLVGVFVLAGCGNGDAVVPDDEAGETDVDGVEESVAVEDIVVGISMPTLQEERWQRDRDIMTEELLSLGVKEENILIQSADGDEQRQVSQSENLITQGIDVLLIIPQSGDATSPIVASAHEAGVQVVAIDRIILNADLDFYVAYDMFDIGVIQAEYITGIIDSGNWVLIGGAPQDPNAAVIRSGQMSVLQPLIDSGNINVVLDQAANYWSPDEALAYTEQALTANNNDIQVVFTTNDGTAGAAIEALTEQGLAGQVPVPGLDADLAACQRIVEGTQTMTVYRKLEMQNRYAAQAAVAFALGKDPLTLNYGSYEIESANNGFKDVPAVLLKSPHDMFAIDKDNMYLVVEDGWQVKEEIFRNIPEDQWPDW